MIFGRPWPVIPSALLIAALNVFLFAFDRPWTASDGMRNWGDGLLQAAGIINQPDLLPPSLYSGSVLNLGLIFGALAAALLSREFAVRPAPPNELFKGALGGLLMGLGAMLSFGCNIGGFFSALSALSLSGVAMMAGVYTWELSRAPVSRSGKMRGSSPTDKFPSCPPARRRRGPRRRLRPIDFNRLSVLYCFSPWPGPPPYISRRATRGSGCFFCSAPLSASSFNARDFVSCGRFVNHS